MARRGLHTGGLQRERERERPVDTKRILCAGVSGGLIHRSYIVI